MIQEMIKLEEGRDYTFKTIRITGLDGVVYYVLEGPDGRRYLLDMERYSGYGIEPGQNIICRVDKINCKGELFLEPMHPVYREGERYPFVTVGYESRIDKQGNSRQVIRFSDNLGNRPLLPQQFFIGQLPKPGDRLQLKVEKIFKGRILLEGMEEEKHSVKEEDLTLNEFVVTDVAPGIDERDYLIVKGQDSKLYSIPSDYYSHYGLKKGTRFKGRFVMYKTGDQVRVEPENPWYVPGNKYSFKVKEIVNLGNERQVITILSDQYGFSHSIEGDTGVEEGGEIVMKVERIRKGWPLLRHV